MRPLVAHCHCGLGTLYAQTGQREQARTALATAMSALPGHGHDLLAAPDGGGAGAGGRTMTLRKGHRATPCDTYAQICQETGKE